MVCIIVGAVFELLGMGLYFYGEYATRNIWMLADALFGYGMIAPGGMMRKMGAGLIVVGAVLLFVGIRSNQKGPARRNADDDDFDELDDLDDDID